MRRLNILLTILLLGMLATASGMLHGTATATAASLGGLPTGNFNPVTTSTGEVVSLRDAHSRTYFEHGHYVAKITAQSSNWQDSTGAWQPVDDSLIAAATSGYAYKNKSNRYTALFPSDIGAGPIRIQAAGGWVEFSLNGIHGTGSVSGGTDTYAIPGGSIAFASEGDSVKESISLASPSSTNAYSYTLRASSGLSFQQNATGGIDILSNGQVLFSLAPPFMQDAAGATSHSVTFTLTPGQGGASTLTVTADPTWLSDPSRQYPVVIDPTVSFSSTTRNCYVDSTTSSSSYCTSVTAKVGNFGPSTNRDLLQFNLSSIPAKSQVLSADFAAYLMGDTGTGAATINLDQITRSWTTSATWNTYDGANAWGTPGGNIATSTPAWSNTVVGPSFNTWYHWYPTQLVQGWVNGTTSNYGMALVKAPEGGTNPVLTFYTSAYQTSADWPTLTVVYQPWVGAQSFSTMESQTLTDHMGFGVNVANGNLFLHESDLAMPGVGLPLTVDRSYNSLATTTGAFGNKWLMATGQDVGLQVYGDGSVGFYGPNGYRVPFIKNSNGSYTAPSGIDATLVKNSDGTYSLTKNAAGDTLTFTSGGFLTSHVDRSGNTISYHYDGSNRLTSITDTQGHTTTFSYNSPSSSTLISQMVDPAGRTYGYVYDANKNLTSYTDPAGTITSFVYDSSNRITQITDPAGNITKFVYNSQGRVSSFIRVTTIPAGTGPTTSFAYNTGNTAVTAPNDQGTHNATTYAYDAYGRVTQVTDPMGHVSHASWTSDSHVTSATSPGNKTVTTSFDGNNNPTQVTLPDGKTETTTYGTGSTQYLPTTMTGPEGQTTSIGYTGSQPTSITNPLGGTSSVTQNANGTVASSTDTNNNTATDTYNSTGQLTGVTLPAGSSFGNPSYTYNSYSLPATSTDGKGQTTHYLYDALGRLTSEGFADGGVVTYAYDANGNVAGTSDATGTTTFTRDSLSNLSTEQKPGGITISYSYDANGNLTTKTDQYGTVTYTYNVDNQATGVTDRQGNTMTVSYNADGEETSIVYPYHITRNFGYDANNSLTSTSTVNTATSTTLQSSTVVHQPQGACPVYTDPYNANLTSTECWTTTDAAGNVTTTYANNANQVMSTTTTAPGGAVTYSDQVTYGTDGKPYYQKQNGTLTTYSYALNTGQMVQSSCSCGNQYLFYDANGKEVQKTDGTHILWSATYNAANQMTSDTGTDGVAHPIVNTGAGEGAPTTSGGTTKQYDSTGLGATTTGFQSTIMTAMPNGQPLEQTTGTDPQVISTNTDGTGTGTVDSGSGTLSGQVVYDANGNPISSSGIIGQVGFDGGSQDPTAGLVLINGVYFDPATMNPIQTPLPSDLWCNEATLSVTSACGGGDAGEVGNGGGGTAGSAGDGDIVTVLPADTELSVEQSWAWQEFDPYKRFQEPVDNPKWQEKLPKIYSQGTWWKVYYNGWDAITGNEESIHYFENSDTRWVTDVKIVDEWSPRP